MSCQTLSNDSNEEKLQGALVQNRRHPKENPHDLTTFGQGKISSFFSLGPSPGKRQGEGRSQEIVQKRPEEDHSEVEDVISVEELDPPSSVDGGETSVEPASGRTGGRMCDNLADSSMQGSLGKRRHTSADSGVVDDEELSEITVKRKRDDHESDNKLDRILSGIEELKSKIDCRVIVDAVGELNAVKGKKLESTQEEILRNLRVARSVEDFEMIGFKYDGESQIFCSVCEPGEPGDGGQAPGIFFYDKELGIEFEDEEVLPQEFSNLKKSLKRHITLSKSHTDSVKSEIEKEKAANELMSKNQKAGIILGNICMKNYKLGRPYTDYEVDVLLLDKSGATVGQLNHSRKFPAAFRPCVQQAVMKRLRKFFSTPLECTGHLPPLAVSADKATYKHRSRQFISVVTINPGGDNFLEIISCGQPVVTGGSSGSELSRNIKSGLDEYCIVGCQLESAVFDGVYFHCSVEEHFNNLYNLEPGSVLYSWDGLHKSGLIDTHLTKMKEFLWLTTFTETCVRIFKLFNWGANYEKMVEATALWKLKLVNLVTFSETRFANSRRRVYQNIHHQLAPVMTCLDNHVKAAERNRWALEAADSKVRERGDAAKELIGKICNVKFLLSLSGLADVYDQYGAVVNVAQMVHLLPHERMDLFNQAVNILSKMADCLEDHSKCAGLCKPGSKVKCLWPLNHKDKTTMVEKKQIMGLDIHNQYEVRAGGLSARTRQTREIELAAASEDAVDKSDIELSALVKELFRGLSTEVYDPKAVEVIEHTRYILDLPVLASKLKEPCASYIILSATDFPKFFNAFESIPVRSLQNIPKEVLSQQHKEFLKRLKKVTEDISIKELKSVDPKEILKKFFNPGEKLFDGIEMILQAVAVSAVKHSCESVLESLVSKFENHFDCRRNLGEDSSAEEFEIAVNGPSLAHCDSIVKESMNLYWQGKPWHFFKTSVMEKIGQAGAKSSVLRRLASVKNHLPIMD